MTQSDKKEEKEKKVDGKRAEKLKFYGVVALLSLLCAGFIWFIFQPDDTKLPEGATGINTTIPDGVAHETEADKRKAYEMEQLKNRRKEKIRNLQDVSGDYLNADKKEPVKEASAGNAIKQSQQQQKQISRQITTFYQEPKKDPRVNDLEKQVKELSERLEREQGKDPLELMEKSYEMAARYFPGQGGQVKSVQPVGSTGGNPAAIAAGRATENVVSSLAAPPPPDTIPRHYGFSTAVGAERMANANTIRACVAEDQTVTTGS